MPATSCCRAKTGQALVKQRLQLVAATPLEPNRHLSSVFPSKLPAAVQSRARGQALITGLPKHLSDGAVGRRLEQLSGF